MFETILTALLPITIVLVLGFFAGYNQDFSKDQASVLNRMVMLYALPLILFSSIATSSISEILKQKDILLGLFIGMVAFYVLVYLLVRYVARQDVSPNSACNFGTCSAFCWGASFGKFVRNG